MTTFNVHYRFDFPDGTTHLFELELGEDTLEQVSDDYDTPPWTALTFHQCPNCPLDPASSSASCPTKINRTESSRKESPAR